MKLSSSFLLTTLLFLVAASGCKKNDQLANVCPQWISPANDTIIRSCDSLLIVLYYAENIKREYDSAFLDFYAFNVHRDIADLTIGDRNNYDSLYVVLRDTMNIIDTINISLNVANPTSALECVPYFHIYVKP